MAQVFTWQLRREMEYPYEAHRPKRQFAAVFNLNRCIACQTCTFACKSTWTFSPGQEAMWWNNVETKPFGGYPQHWDVKILRLLEEQAGWDISQIEENSPYGVYLGKTIFEMAKETISDNAKKAIYKRPEDGIVLLDQSSCRGYRKCVEQCPYKKSMFNPVTRISEKCIGCYPRVEEGTIPRCMAAFSGTFDSSSTFWCNSKHPLFL